MSRSSTCRSCSKTSFKPGRQSTGRLAPVADPIFPRGAQLGRAFQGPGRDKDRIVAEPAPPFLIESDRSAANSPEYPEELPTGGHRRHANEAGLPAGGRDTLEDPQQFR